MKHYYSDDVVTLYHGDCLEVTEWLAADVLVTDPPYGMGYESFGSSHKAGIRRPPTDKIAGDESTDARDATLRAWGDRPALVFGTWRVDRPLGVRTLLVWDKGLVGMGALDLPWGPAHEEIYVFGKGFTGHRRGNVLRVKGLESQDARREGHPTPKPLRLMYELVSACPPGVIADPYAGTGTTLVAAKGLGRKAIGIEIDERYCETAAKRLAQDVLDLGGIA